MRSFGAAFAAELARDDAEPFLTAVFRFGDGRAPAYVSDRDVTFGGNVHMPIIAWPDGWGELSSVFDRQSLAMDVQTMLLSFINYPLPSELTFPSGIIAGMRWSEVLKRHAEAIEVDVIMNVRRASDLIVFQEPWFTGIVQGGPTAASYERCQCRIVSLTEKYLLGNALRLVDSDVFKFARESDRNATIPLTIGDVPRALGRVVKGRLVSTPVADPGNDPASGELGDIEISTDAIRLYYYSLRLATQSVTVTVTFTGALAFIISGYIGTNQTGLITEDFTTEDGVFTIPSASWRGVFVSGDKFTFQIDASRSEVVLSDRPDGMGFDAIDTVQCNDVSLEQRDIVLKTTAAYDVNGGVSSMKGSTMVRFDGYTAGASGNFRLVGLNSAGGSAPSYCFYALVMPFVVPEMLADSRLLKVGLKLGRTGTPPPINVAVLDTFNPSGIGFDHFSSANWKRSYVTFGGEEYSGPQHNEFFTGGDVNGIGGSGPTFGAGESFLSRAHPYFAPALDDIGADYSGLPHASSSTGGNSLIWFGIDEDLVPGRQYYFVVVCEDELDTGTGTRSTNSDYWYVARQRGAADDDIFVTPPAPARGLRLYARDYFKPAYLSQQSNNQWMQDGSKIFGVWVYAGGIFASLSAPGTASYLQRIKVNKGLIATRLGVIVKGNPEAFGSVLVELKAAETTGQDRQLVGSVQIPSSAIRDIPSGQNHGIEDWLDRPTLVRPGFYNVHVHVQADELGNASGITLVGDYGDRVGSGLLSGSGVSNVQAYPVRGARLMPVSPSRDLTTTVGGVLQYVSIGIVIRAAVMTKELNALDDAGRRVARVTFDCYLPDDFIMTANVRGLRYSASRNPSRVIEGLLKSIPVPAGSIDVAGTFAATLTALGALGYTFDGQVLEQQSWKQLFLRMAFECRSVFDWSVDQARLKFTPSAPGSSVFSIDYDETLARGLVPEVTTVRSDVAKLINSIDVLYARKYAHGTDEWAGKFHDEDKVSVKINGKREKPDLFKMTLIRNRPVAQNLLDFYLYRFANARDSIQVQTPLLTGAVEKDDQGTLTNL